MNYNIAFYLMFILGYIAIIFYTLPSRWSRIISWKPFQECSKLYIKTAIIFGIIYFLGNDKTKDIILPAMTAGIAVNCIIPYFNLDIMQTYRYTVPYILLYIIERNLMILPDSIEKAFFIGLYIITIASIETGDGAKSNLSSSNPFDWWWQSWHIGVCGQQRLGVRAKYVKKILTI